MNELVQKLTCPSGNKIEKSSDAVSSVGIYHKTFDILFLDWLMLFATNSQLERRGWGRAGCVGATNLMLHFAPIINLIKERMAIEKLELKHM
jgi:hypothetical protein